MKLSTTLVTFSLAISALAAPAAATTAVYTIAGQGSGSLDGTPFETNFTFVLTGDTSNVIANTLDPLATATFAITGRGTGSFSIPTRLGVAGTSVVYFSRASSSGLDLFDFNAASPIDLLTNFATTGSGVNALNQFVNVSTSLGNLTFNQSSGVTFTGRVGETQGAVPEPATWAMMLLGFGMAGSALRYRRRSPGCARA